jgi:uncharacterized repeat protein (TIGR03806 family)
MTTRLPLASALLLMMIASAGCSRAVHPYLEEPYPAKLSAWKIFRDQGMLEQIEKSRFDGPKAMQGIGDHQLNDGVIPYEVNSPLFSDYATKARTVWMPPGTTAVYKADGVFEMPVGTILSKTFSFAGRLIETRLLVHMTSGWVGLPYVWNDAQSEATLEVTGATRNVSWTNPSGKRYDIEYRVPNVNQCKECHERYKVMSPIGVRARQLNLTYNYLDRRLNQLDYWKQHNILQGAPPHEEVARMATWDDPSTGDTEARARAYLDSNCAHCHQPGSAGDTAGLYLGLDVVDPLRLGVCKTPVSAGLGSGGRLFAVVPGKADDSFMAYRMDSVQPKVMMPELGRTVIHAEGVALIREWINGLATSSSCDSPDPTHPAGQSD